MVISYFQRKIKLLLFRVISTEGTQQAEVSSTDDATPGPSSSQTTADQIRRELESLGMPEGVDPSFLAALPDNIRWVFVCLFSRSEATSRISRNLHSYLWGC